MSRLYLIFGLSLLVTAKTELLASEKFQHPSSIPWSSGMIFRFAELYLKEIKMRSPLYFAVHSKVKSNTASRVIKEFSKKIPTLTQQLGDDIPYVLRRLNATDTKLKNFQAIYQNVQDLNLKSLKNVYKTNWNTRSRIAVWIVEEGRKESYFKILGEFWSNNCLNVVLITKSKMPEEMTIFGYNPFLRNRQNQAGTFYELSKTDSLYPDKLANMHGSPIRMSLYKRVPYSITNNKNEFIGGVDVECMWMASKWLNFSIDLITAPVLSSSYVMKLADGSEVGVVGDVLTNRSDIIMTAQYLAVVNEREVEIVHPFYYTDYVIIAPKAETMPAILKSILRFSRPVLIVLGLSILILVISLAAMNSDDVMLTALELLLHQRFANIAATNFARLFSISWICGSFVISTVYLSYLVKDMFTVYHYKDIDTLAELYDSGLTLMVGDRMLDTLRNSHVEDKRKLYERALENLNFTDCVMQLINCRNVSCGMDTTFQPEYHGDDTLSVDVMKTHVLEEYLNRHWITYVTQDGFPALEKFNYLLRQLMQFGLCKKWLHDRIEESKVTNQDIVFTLRLRHLDWSLRIFLIGCATACVVFLLELVFGKTRPFEKAGRIFREIGPRSKSSVCRSSRVKPVAVDGEFDGWYPEGRSGEARAPKRVTGLE